jgi:hypothetical protein
MSGAPARMLAVVDLDGVVADVRHRLRFVEDRPKNWRRFFEAAPHDPVLDEGRRVVEALAGVHDLAYLSGRPEFCRTDTEAWLARHRLPEAPVLLRPGGELRPARDVKITKLRELSVDREIAVLVDDDPLVCDAARAAGFDVLPATWMGTAPTLIEAQEVDGET